MQRAVLRPQACVYDGRTIPWTLAQSAQACDDHGCPRPDAQLPTPVRTRAHSEPYLHGPVPKAAL
eukprot:7135711-Alexandrium_andersonii.AAC.1